MQIGDDAHQPERHQGVPDAAACFGALPRHEVVKAFSGAELRDAVERRVDQEQLLVGAERRSVERAGEHDRNRKRRDEPDRPAGHQQQRRLRDLVPTEDVIETCEHGLHAAWTRSHRRAGGQRPWVWQSRMTDENEPSAAIDEPSHSSNR